MNRLTTEERTRVIAQLVEGCSIRTTVRITGIAKKTVMRLLVEVGDACKAYCDKTMRDLDCKRLECDEIWSYCGCKAKNLTPENQDKGWGDAWCWVAIDRKQN
ncbi:MAG TPA: hypothetical protein VFQ43_04275 [Nitrososphaera sp.]|nr:hypothetical protein [Nitrososphaera sp.]